MTTQHTWTLHTLIEAYKQHQRRTRGLCDPTVHGYERLVRPLARAVFWGRPSRPHTHQPLRCGRVRGL